MTALRIFAEFVRLCAVAAGLAAFVGAGIVVAAWMHP